MSRRVVGALCCALLLYLAPGCSDEKNGDYQGVSELISNRNQARHNVKGSAKGRTSSKPVKTTEQDPKSSLASQDAGSKKKEISSVVLYEENVTIVSQTSSKTLAKGIAYINKQGQIVRLKIVNE